LLDQRSAAEHIEQTHRPGSEGLDDDSMLAFAAAARTLLSFAVYPALEIGVTGVLLAGAVTAIDDLERPS